MSASLTSSACSAAAFAAAAAVLSFLTGAIPVSRMPQASSGGDALSVAFGEAKDTISLAMNHKADSYFHGGVDMDCTLDRDDDHDEHEHGEHDHDDHDHDGDHDEEHCHDENCPHHHHHHHHHDGEAEHHDEEGAFLDDPWRWINVRVRAPEIEKHLEGRKAVETMPWLWAAVRANPHNVDAWTTAWYMANTVMQDRALAARIIEEAKLKNPDSLEIALTDGRFAYDKGKGDVPLAEKKFRAARDIALRKCGGNVSDLSEPDRETFCNIVDFISKIASERKDVAELQRLLQEVEATGESSPVRKSIERRIKECSAK